MRAKKYRTTRAEDIYRQARAFLDLPYFSASSYGPVFGQVYRRCVYLDREARRLRQKIKALRV